jgi:hypothetical protein
MRTNITLVFAFILVTVAFTACGGPSSTPNTNAGNTANTNSTNPLETNRAAPEQLVNNAPTLTPLVRAYCDAWVKMDEVALRKIYSADEIRRYEEEMKAEKAKSLIKMLEPTDRVKPSPCEAKNEKITGDTAIATITTSKNPNGVPVRFVKENGEWKMTNMSPAIDAVTKPAQPPANATK